LQTSLTAYIINGCKEERVIITNLMGSSKLVGLGQSKVRRQNVRTARRKKEMYDVDSTALQKGKRGAGQGGAFDGGTARWRSNKAYHRSVKSSEGGIWQVHLRGRKKKDLNQRLYSRRNDG